MAVFSELCLYERHEECDGTRENDAGEKVACSCPCHWTERERQAWDEDEADMARIAREWSEYDRDPPGS